MAKNKPIRPKGAAKRGSGLGSFLVPTLLVLILLGALVVLAFFVMDSSPPPSGPEALLRKGAAASSSSSYPSGLADGKCEDAHEMCDAWHKAGVCRRSRPGAPSPTQMLQTCPGVCGQCPGNRGRVPPVPREARCRRDNVSAAVPAGHLTPLFERVLRDFPEYSPEALATDPYVVILHDFITPEEAEAFQEVCRPHFERSLAGDQLNPVRTSFQCWCNFPGCFMNEHVHRVVRRINHVTGTGFNNGEDLQIVRYEPGQFYKVHHDQNTAVWAPQGPRVLTFFMYLNTPEGGGETWFPQARADDLARSPLDLGEAWLRWVAECAVKHAHGATTPPPGCSSRPSSRGGSGTGSPPPPPSQVRGVDGSQGVMVQPKLGSAILWPSTLDQQPMDADHRTNHEARAVTQGIKYGSNMWIHQFDFKTPSERGCQLTYVNTMGAAPRDPEHQKLVEGYVPKYTGG